MQKLMKSPDPDVADIAGALMLTAANNRLIGSICAQLRANLRFVRYPMVRASLERSDFSLRALCGRRPVALFLQFEEGHRETTARLLAATVAHVLRYFITHHEREPVLLLLDEIGTAPVIPSLVQKLNTIRSRKLPTWLYWQSLEQMQAYGAKADEGPNIILGACDMQMVFRLNDNASALWMSDRIGKVDREVEAVAVKIGELAQKSRSLVTEPIVWPHELQALAANEVVCTYRGNTWRGIARPYYELWPEYRGKTPVATRGLAYANQNATAQVVDADEVDARHGAALGEGESHAE
jgi:type IV secretion system protein VirD4